MNALVCIYDLGKNDLGNVSFTLSLSEFVFLKYMI